jgi:hypothetical protein
MGIKKETPLQLTLSAAEINTILDGLAAMPYKQVFHLIARIHEQINQQTQNPNQQAPLQTD